MATQPHSPVLHPTSIFLTTPLGDLVCSQLSKLGQLRTLSAITRTSKTAYAISIHHLHRNVHISDVLFIDLVASTPWWKIAEGDEEARKRMIDVQSQSQSQSEVEPLPEDIEEGNGVGNSGKRHLQRAARSLFDRCGRIQTLEIYISREHVVSTYTVGQVKHWARLCEDFTYGGDEELLEAVDIFPKLDTLIIHLEDQLSPPYRSDVRPLKMPRPFMKTPGDVHEKMMETLPYVITSVCHPRQLELLNKNAYYGPWMMIDQFLDDYATGLEYEPKRSIEIIRQTTVPGYILIGVEGAEHHIKLYSSGAEEVQPIPELGFERIFAGAEEEEGELAIMLNPLSKALWDGRYPRTAESDLECDSDEEHEDSNDSVDEDEDVHEGCLENTSNPRTAKDSDAPPIQLNKWHISLEGFWHDRPKSIAQLRDGIKLDIDYMKEDRLNEAERRQWKDAISVS